MHDFNEGIFFPDNCCYENNKKTFLQWSQQRLLRGKDASLGNSMIIHPGHITNSIKLLLSDHTVYGIFVWEIFVIFDRLSIKEF